VLHVGCRRFFGVGAVPDLQALTVSGAIVIEPSWLDEIDEGETQSPDQLAGALKGVNVGP
jgi:hypothetical protein